MQLLRHTVTLVYTFVNARRRINRYIQFFSQSAYRLYMVGMVMGNEHRTYHFHIDTCLF